MVFKLVQKLFLASLFLSLVLAKVHTSSFELYQKGIRDKTLNPPSAARLLQTPEYHIKQIGEDIDGEDYYGRSGHSLSLSANGMLLAVGSYSAYGYTGHVTTYVFHTNSETWVQRGQKIIGESRDDRSGGSISLSHDGMTMAIGASQNRNYYGHTRVFGWDVTSQLWIQIGQDLDGTARNGYSGAALALSGDGRRLAIGTPGATENTGHAKIFERSGDSWIQLGSTIHGDDVYSALGGSLAMTDDGGRVIIGSPLEHENDTYYVGSVSVFEYSDGDWTQLGQDLTGGGYYDRFGTSVDISGDGSRIIIGVPNDDKGKTNQGSARVYEYDKADGWVQLGTQMIGEEIGDALGTSVSMSQDGNRILLGASYHDSGGDNAGCATVYEFVPESSDWVQVDTTIIGGEVNGSSGSAVSISPDGKIVAVGAPLNSNYYGHTRVYKIEATTRKKDITESPSASSSNWPTTFPSVTTSMSPTAAPSNAKLSQPSNQPTALPSMTSLNPTPTPTFSTSPPSKDASLSPSAVPLPLCKDSPLKMTFEKRTPKKCVWVGKDPLKRCKMASVKSHCPFTCNSPASCNEDSTKTFLLKKELRSCEWASRNPTKRCKRRSIRKTCRLSCKGM